MNIGPGGADAPWAARPSARAWTRLGSMSGCTTSRWRVGRRAGRIGRPRARAAQHWPTGEGGGSGSGGSPRPKIISNVSDGSARATCQLHELDAVEALAEGEADVALGARGGAEGSADHVV